MMSFAQRICVKNCRASDPIILCLEFIRFLGSRSIGAVEETFDTLRKSEISWRRPRGSPVVDVPFCSVNAETRSAFKKREREGESGGDRKTGKKIQERASPGFMNKSGVSGMKGAEGFARSRTFEAADTWQNSVWKFEIVPVPKPG